MRETTEEIGCNVHILDKEPIFYSFNIDDLEILLIHYFARLLDSEPRPCSEIEEIMWADLNNLPTNIFDNVKIILSTINNV